MLVHTEIPDATQKDKHLQALTTYIINGWSQTKAKVKQDEQPYWTFHDDLLVIDRIVKKAKG